MKYKNARSSGRAVGLASVVWTWEHTRIAASTHLQLKAEDWNQHDVRSLRCAIPNDVITEPEPNLNQFSQIEHSNLENELNVIKHLNKTIKSKSKSKSG